MTQNRFSQRSSGERVRAEPTQLRLFARRFFRHRLALTGMVILGVLVISCFGAPWLAPYPENQQDLITGSSGISAAHWLGTDQLGRDFLSQLLYAGRVSMSVGLGVGVLATAVGVLLGSIAGYVGGWIDELIMRLVDLFLIVPPLAVLALILQGFGTSTFTIVLALSSLAWTVIARVARGQVLSLKEKEFVEAAIVLGASPLRVMLRHLVPNLAGVIAVNVSLAVAAAIITESTLSFLGFGVQPPASSWGNLLSQAAGLLGTPQVHLLLYPGLLILLTVLAVNFIGDGLRDAFDPQTQR